MPDKTATGRPDAPAKPSYYDISMLKAPVWTWEVAGYFFLGGVSAGAYVLARMAERFGGKAHRDVTRAGTFIALLTALPCAPLLILDLGDRKRFHHMLRVFKPNSPMNLGSWVLTSCSALLTLATLREVLDDRRDELPADAVSFADRAINFGDITALPLVLMLGSYTGVLLSATSTPIWSRNKWLAPLFSASSMSTGAAAISLALDVAADEETASKAIVQKAETAARVAEAAALTGYVTSAGQLARPLTTGPGASQFWLGAVAGSLVLPELLQRLPAPGKIRRWPRAGPIVEWSSAERRNLTRL